LVGSVGIALWVFFGCSNVVGDTYDTSDLVQEDEAEDQTSDDPAEDPADDSTEDPIDEPDPHIYPHEVTISGGSIGDTEIALQWEIPTDPSFDHVEISYAQISVLSSTATTITLTENLQNGVTTEVTFTSVDKDGNRSEGVTLFLTPSLTPSDLSIVDDVSDLNAMRNDLGGYYLLIRDIDAASIDDWTSVGTNAANFEGTFEGNGHSISNLTMTPDGDDAIGLFGYTRGAIARVTLANVNMSGTSGGAIATENRGSILAASATGVVSANGSGGGLVGVNQGGTIARSYAAVDVTATSWWVGGLVAQNIAGTITQSYAIGTVDGDAYTGGLVGENDLHGEIEHAYFQGTVRGPSGIYEVAGLVGRNDGSVIQCFVSATVYAGPLASAFVHGLGSASGGAVTESDLRASSTFTDWSFAEIWSIDPEAHGDFPYPHLLGLDPPPVN